MKASFLLYCIIIISPTWAAEQKPSFLEMAMKAQQNPTQVTQKSSAAASTPPKNTLDQKGKNSYSSYLSYSTLVELWKIEGMRLEGTDLAGAIDRVDINADLSWNIHITAVKPGTNSPNPLHISFYFKAPWATVNTDENWFKLYSLFIKLGNPTGAGLEQTYEVTGSEWQAQWGGNLALAGAPQGIPTKLQEALVIEAVTFYNTASAQEKWNVKIKTPPNTKVSVAELKVNAPVVENCLNQYRSKKVYSEQSISEALSLTLVYSNRNFFCFAIVSACLILFFTCVRKLYFGTREMESLLLEECEI